MLQQHTISRYGIEHVIKVPHLGEQAIDIKTAKVPKERLEYRHDLSNEHYKVFVDKNGELFMENQSEE